MAMKYFSILTDLQLDIPVHSPYTDKYRKSLLMPTAKQVTLAQYSPTSANAITAHRLSDYRRRQFSLVLLPDVHIWMEELWNVNA